MARSLNAFLSLFLNHLLPCQKAWWILSWKAMIPNSNPRTSGLSQFIRRRTTPWFKLTRASIKPGTLSSSESSYSITTSSRLMPNRSMRFGWKIQRAAGFNSGKIRLNCCSYRNHKDIFIFSPWLWVCCNKSSNSRRSRSLETGKFNSQQVQCPAEPPSNWPSMCCQNLTWVYCYSFAFNRVKI